MKGVANDAMRWRWVTAAVAGQIGVTGYGKQGERSECLSGGLGENGS